MKTNRRRVIYALMVCGLLGTGLSLVAAPPERGGVAFADMDLNGDQRISLQEFYQARNDRIAERAKAGGMMRNLGNAPAFEALDGDGDGYLSELELLRGQVAQMQQNRGVVGGRAGTGRMAMGQASFADFDRDGDGAVTRDEFNQTRTERQAEKAKQGYPMRNAASAPTFEAFDRDGDGRLTADEFTPGRGMQR